MFMFARAVLTVSEIEFDSSKKSAHVIKTKTIAVDSFGSSCDGFPAEYAPAVIAPTVKQKLKTRFMGLEKANSLRAVLTKLGSFSELILMNYI